MADVRVKNFTNISNLSNDDELLIDSSAGVRNITYQDLKTNINDDVAVPATYSSQNAPALSFDGASGSAIDLSDNLLPVSWSESPGFIIFNVNPLNLVTSTNTADLDFVGGQSSTAETNNRLFVYTYKSKFFLAFTDTLEKAELPLEVGTQSTIVITWDGVSELKYKVSGNDIVTTSYTPTNTAAANFLSLGSNPSSTSSGNINMDLYGFSLGNTYLPTESSNPNSIPYTIEDAASGKDVPVELRGGLDPSYGISFQSSTVDNGDGTYRITGSGSILTTVTNHEIRIDSIANLEINQFFKVKFRAKGVSGGEILYFGWGYGGSNGVSSETLTTSWQEFEAIDFASSTTGAFGRFNFGADTSSLVDIEILGFTRLGTVAQLDSHNLRIPSGHKQVVDASGNDNTFALSGGVEATQEGDTAVYEVSNIDVSSNSFIVSSSENTIENTDVIHYKITNNSGSSITGFQLQASDGGSNHFNLHTATGSIADGSSILVTCDQIPPDDRYQLRVPAVTAATDVSMKITVQKK